jgi:hypothetical protein
MGVAIAVAGTIIPMLVSVLVGMISVIPVIAVIAAGESHSPHHQKNGRGKFEIFHAVYAQIVQRTRTRPRMASAVYRFQRDMA